MEKQFTKEEVKEIFYQTIAYMWDRRNKKTNLTPEEFFKQLIEDK